MMMERKPRNPLTWLGRQLGTKFGIGIITIVPFAATIWILYWVFINIDRILQPAIRTAWGNAVPGAGFVAGILLILLVGFFASNVIGRRLIRYAEKVTPWMPIFHQLYTGIKQILESFSASRAATRMQPVIVEFPRKGIKTLGFITNEIRDKSEKRLFTIFIPTSPNPTSGFLEIAEESEITRTNISIEDALKMVVSAGKVIPNEVSEALFLNNRQT